MRSRKFGQWLASLCVIAGVLVSTAPAALADTTYLPWPAAASCSGSIFYAGSSNGTNDFWTAFRFTVTNTVTVSSAIAYLQRNPTTIPTKIEIRDNGANVGTGSWTVLGTLNQDSFTLNGAGYNVNYSGSVTLTPGTYWIDVRGTTLTTPSQGVCTTSGSTSQTPWSIDSSTPWGYVTSNGGATYSTQGGTAYQPFISLSGNPPVSISSNAAPEPLFQQFGKPASGTCDAAQPAGLNWAGVSSGGWASSWSQWMNGGNGGFVCARTLIYSTNQAKWIVG